MDQPVAAHQLVVAAVVSHAVQNIASLPDRAAAADPDRIALIVIDEVITYRQLSDASLSTAAILHHAGIGPGDHVPLVAWGGLGAVAGTLACAHLGAAAAAMNPLLTEGELAQLRDIAGCTAVEVPAEVPVPAVPVPEVPALATGTAVPASATGSAVPAAAVPPELAAAARTRLVLFTSGTTGLPKAVPISHDGLFARMAAYRAPFESSRPPGVSLMCVPAFHVGGLLGLLLSLYSGDTTVIQPRFDAGQWLALAERHRVGSAFLVPTMLQRILDHPDFASTDLSALNAIAYGAAAASPALIERAMAALPHVAFANVFGQTETLGAYTTLSPADHHDPKRAGSVGRPLPGIDVRIVDPDTDADVTEVGVAGELWVRGVQAMVAGNGWLHTGDLARRDADGYLYPEGRLTETINRGGEKFGPIEIVTVLRRHPEIIDVAVIGIRDDEMGERVGVAVVAAPQPDDG